MELQITTRTTPDWIVAPAFMQIVVVGTNLQGIHGKALAKQALQWGLKKGVGRGYSGNTYALPTRNFVSRGNIISLPLDKIKAFVDFFIVDATNHPEYTHLVTKIGCGEAGYTPEQIAPMFQRCVTMMNVWLPKEFWEVLL